MTEDNLNKAPGICQPCAGNKKIVTIAPRYAAYMPDLEKQLASAAMSANEIIDLSALDIRHFNLALLMAEADILLLVIDASFGLEKRDFWAEMLACLGSVPHIVLAIDNMEQVDWSQKRFAELKDEFSDYPGDFDCKTIHAIPVNISSGDGVGQVSSRLSWYDGPVLVELLENLPGEAELAATDAPDAPLPSSDQFAVHLCWAGKTAMLPGRNYHFRKTSGNCGSLGEKTIEGHVSTLKHRLNPETLEHVAVNKLLAGDIGYGNIALSDPVEFRPFSQDRKAGAFTLHDEVDGTLVAFGMIKHELRRATNIKWHKLEIDKSARAASKKQTPFVLWFTGLSGSGKSSIASMVDKKIHAMGKHSYVLDGDNVRHGLCRDLGFTDADRVENLRRISETSKLFIEAGLIVLVSFISPFRSERLAARELFEDGEFLEVFVDTPLEVCEARDVKGLYKKARSGQLKNFTGIDSPYEPPENAEIILAGDKAPAHELADLVIEEVMQLGLLKPPGP